MATIRVIELIAQATFGEGKAQTLPKGTVNVVTGPAAASARNSCATRASVDRLYRLDAGGRHVMEVAGREIKRVTLELGGVTR